MNLLFRSSWVLLFAGVTVVTTVHCSDDEPTPPPPPVDGGEEGAAEGGQPVQADVLARNLDTPSHFTIDATGVYLSLNNTIVSVPLEGGDPRTLASGRLLPAGIALDEGAVYWAERFANKVFRIAKNGGTEPELLADLSARSGRPEHLVLAGDRLYWSNSGDGTIMTCAIAACSPTFFASSGNVGGMAADDTHVYWAVGAVVARKARLPAGLVGDGGVDGGTKDAGSGDGGSTAVESVAQATAEIAALKLDGDHVYWTTSGAAPPSPGGDAGDGGSVVDAASNNPGECIKTSQAVGRAPKAGGQAEAIVGEGCSGYGIEVAAGTVYWSDQGGNVSKVPATGGAPVGLVQASARMLKIHDGHLYWVTRGESDRGDLMRLRL